MRRLSTLIRGVSMAMAVLPAMAYAHHAAPVGQITIDLSAHKPVQTIRPDEDLGAALDGTDQDEVNPLYTPHNIKAMLTAGLGPVTYRLRTELGIEAWHWNTEGTWSDPEHQQGYWTSSDKPGAPIMLSHGYSLPRRGNSVDNADNRSYSRLDDGDESDFWKSNPYLDKHFTGLTDNRPQWAIIDLGVPTPINAARIAWAEPYATAFDVQYWVGEEYSPKGYWVTFPGGHVTDGKGGTSVLNFGDTPIKTEFVRLWLKEGSGTAPAGSTDIRDRLGYAVREFYVGTTGADGAFHDIVRRGKEKDHQSLVLVSSTDPWHRATDMDADLEQPGVDRLFASGITRGLPVMIPVGAMFDTPDNAAALIRYIKARHYPLQRVELGEEPDGQNVSGRDYADLYIQAADAVHGVDPKLQLGGPSLQDGVTQTWLDDDPDKSFTSQFVKRLAARGRLGDLNFFSYERYPFDNTCQPTQAMLLSESDGMVTLMHQMDVDGVPKNVDRVITEYGFSAFAGRVEVEVPSALLNADIVGQFLALGGKSAYLFGYGPGVPEPGPEACAGYGDMMLHQADENGQAKWPMPIYYGARMMTQQWAMPGHGAHAIYPAASDIVDAQGHALVTAYAILRPDHQWALMIVNRDGQAAHRVRFAFKGGRGGFGRGLTVVQYSPAQFAWKADRMDGHPTRNRPPVTFRSNGSPLNLPAFSLTVVRGKGALP